MGHVLGAEKGFFLIRADDGPMLHGGRAGLILSIPAKEVSLGSPRVGTRHVQSPTPHTPPLRAILVDFSQQPTEEQQLLVYFGEPSDSSANVAGGAFREARRYVPGPLL